jgi:hypothetical protein
MASDNETLYLNDCNYGTLKNYEWNDFLENPKKEKAIVKIKLQDGSRINEIDKREFKAYIELDLVSKKKVCYRLGDEKIEFVENLQLKSRLEDINWTSRLKVYEPAIIKKKKSKNQQKNYFNKF